jgi:hypothetical protein
MRHALRLLPVSTLLLGLIEAGGDPSIFCYRMGVDILSAGQARFLTSATRLANLPGLTIVKRNQVACSTLFSTFSARFSILKD